MTAADDAVDRLRRAQVDQGDLVALVFAEGVGVAMVPLPMSGVAVAVAAATIDGVAEIVRAVEDEIGPRWVLWSGSTLVGLVGAGVRLRASWDLGAVHRLIDGGWRSDPARVWARCRGLPAESIPSTAPPDLFSSLDADAGEPDEPVRPDGYLRPDWADDGWSTSVDRLERWAGLAAIAVAEQQRHVAGPAPPGPAPPSPGPPGDRLPGGAVSPATVRSESACELLCAELSVDGLPIDLATAEAIIAGFVGPRPRSDAEADQQRARRDAEVLHHAPGSAVDLRNAGQVKSLLRRVGVEVPDTRAWRLESLRDVHPLVDALLVWRKAERIATTFGFGWLDAHVDADGRLRGSWSGSDGAAGRMTATAGLHNMPADLRGAVLAEPGHVFVRADLGQIEPRVLASVSGDPALAAATLSDDLYAPVAAQLGVDRATAKVAVLGAMYGQTTGHGAQALARLRASYPVAMAYLDEADRAAQVGQDLRTFGGRLVRMGSANVSGLSDREARSRAAARGRYGRNAMVQGAAAELFKVWAVLVRFRGAVLDARIVLCLHDELLVHVPIEHGAAAAQLVADCLQEAAFRWAPDDAVRFIAEISVIARWSEAKDDDTPPPS